MKKRILPLFVVLAGLLAAGCDELTEPVAVTPDALRPAIVTPLTQRIDEDGALLLEVQAEDPNGEVMTLSITAAPTHGSAVLAGAASPPTKTPAAGPPRTTGRTAALRADIRVLEGPALRKRSGTAVVVGRIRYTPSADFHGTDGFGLVVRNASGFRTEAAVTVTIDAVPDAPRVVAPIPTQTLAVGGIPFSIDLTDVFSDPDGEPLQFAAGSSNAGTAGATVNGDILVVTAQQPGTATVVVTATDPGGLTGTTSFAVTGGGNRCPVRNGDIGPQVLEVGGLPFVLDDLNVFYSDPDGDPLTFSAFSTDPSISTATVEGSRLTVTKERIGLAAVTVIARDAICAADEPISFTVTDPNAPEVIAPIDDQVLEAGQTFVVDDLNAVFQDPDGGALAFSAETSNTSVATAAVAGSRLTVTAHGDGQALLTVIARKADGRSIQDQFLVTVETNQPPVAVDDQYSVQEGTPFTVNAAGGVLANDADPDGDPLTAVLAAGPANGTLTLQSNGGFTYTPDAGFSGTDAFTYRASDGTASSNVATVRLVPTTSNQPPMAVDDQYSVQEGTPLTVNAAGGVLANDADPDGDPLTAVLAAGPANGTLTLQSNGGFTYTPDAGFSGTDAFTYRASDGTASSNVATVRLVPTTSNQPPMAVDDQYSVQEGTPLTVNAAGGVLANDADPDGDPLTAVLAAGPANGTLTLQSNGGFTYTPDAGFSGTDAFTYRASDGTAASNLATASIVVNRAGNTPPDVTDPGPQFSDEGENLALQIVASDPDTPLRYASTTLPPGLSLNTNTGLISGRVAADATGQLGTRTYPVEILITDNRSAQTTLRFDWTITNPAPLVTPPPPRNDADGTAISFLISAADDDFLTFDDEGTLPPGVSLNTATGVLTGSLTTDASGPSGSRVYPVRIVVFDGQNGVTRVTFDWTVFNPLPDVTAPQDQTNVEGDAVELAIDASDDDPLTFAATRLPNGLSIDPASGEITGTLATNAADGSPYAVEVGVTDAQGAGVVVLFTWTVSNPVPVVVNPGPQTHEENETVSLQIDATDDDGITFAATGLPDGLSINTFSGTITGTITDDAAGNSPYNVDVTVTDSQGANANATFTWTVIPANPMPGLTSLSPSSAAAGTTLDVFLSGSGFIDGVSSVAFSPNTGITINTLTVTGSTQIILNISIDASASPTGRSVTVTNDPPGGGTSNSQNFVITN